MVAPMSKCAACGRDGYRFCTYCAPGDDCATNGKTLLESKWGKRLVVARNECDGRYELQLFKHENSGKPDAREVVPTNAIDVSPAGLRSLAAALVRYADEQEAEHGISLDPWR